MKKRNDRQETPAANSTYPKVAVQWLNKAFCFYQSLCLIESEVLRKRHLRVAAKRVAKSAPLLWLRRIGDFATSVRRITSADVARLYANFAKSPNRYLQF
jgi:hypothetical protein